MQNFSSLRDLANNVVMRHGVMEVKDHVIYDTLKLQPTDNVFFRHPIGVDNKPLSDTNMVQSTQLPKSQAFWCDGITLQMTRGREVMLRRAVLTVAIGSKQYHTLPAMMFLRSQFLAEFDPIKVIYPLSIGLAIVSEMNFHAELRLPEGMTPQGLFVRCELSGKLFRPVQ